MAKIIAVIGSPGSGKTTVTLKLAQELYCATTSGAVIHLSPSLRIPALGVLFPNYTPDSIFSLGTMFDKTDIYEEDILNHLVTVKAMKNFGCLGYKAGENKNSFATLTDDKVKALFDVLHKMVGYVFVDCTDEEDDLISQYALGMADEVIMKNGKFCSNFSCYGYKRGAEGIPEIIPEEAEVVRFIYDRYLDGYSIEQIRSELFNRGIKTSKGKDVWGKDAISSILKNEKYQGDLLLQKTYRTDCITKKTKVNKRVSKNKG